MKKFIKLFISIFFLLFIFWWLVLSPVSFPDSGYYSSVSSPDKKWRIDLYSVAITTPFALIQALNNKKYIVLFDKNSNYVGQISPFCMIRLEGLQDDYAFFPSKEGESFGYLGADCDYIIPINEKKWWSKIIGFISY
jgi:hypothetical protein